MSTRKCYSPSFPNFDQMYINMKNSNKNKTIGEGSFGSVKYYEEANIAFKNITIPNPQMGSSDSGLTPHMLSELNILSLIANTSPYIVSIYGYCIDYFPRQLSIAMEYMTMDLSALLYKHKGLKYRIVLGSNKDEELSRPILFKLVFDNISFALNYLHSLNIGNYDIKPSNILLKLVKHGDYFYLENIKMADFGLSRFSDKSMQNIGPMFTPYYQPPEFFNKTNTTQFDKLAGDVWSLGTTLMEVLMGKLLFHVDENNNLAFTTLFIKNSVNPQQQVNIFQKQSKEGTISGRINVPELLNKYYQNVPYIVAHYPILTSMLEFNPTNRPSIDQIIKLRHQNPIINSPSFNFSDILNKNIPSAYYPRYITHEVKQYILEVQQNVSNITKLIAMEFTTRYLGLINEEYNKYPRDMKKQTILSCFFIICKFTNEKIPIETFFGQYGLQPGTFIADESKILLRMEFKIYNLGLGNIINRMQDKKINLLDLPSNRFYLPIDQWF